MDYEMEYFEYVWTRHLDNISITTHYPLLVHNSIYYLVCEDQRAPVWYHKLNNSYGIKY